MPQERKEEPFVLNPIIGLAFIGTCCVCGFGWIPYAIAMLVISNIVGFYVESKINELDQVTRQKAYEATGNEQPGNASEVGELIRKANQTLGVFCPFLPLVSLVYGWYASIRAYRLSKVGCKETNHNKPTALARGFAAEGRCVF